MATDYTADANCQGAWLFASGSELIDSSGEGNTLTNNNTVTFSSTTLPTGYTTGQYGVFNGTNQYLSRAYANLSANFPGKVQKVDMACAAWLKRSESGTATKMIMAQTYGGSWDLRINPSHQLEVKAVDQGGQLFWCTMTGAVANDTNWHHIAWSFDGVEPSGTLRYWFDGGAGTNITATNVADIAGPGFGNLGIGATDGSVPFPGNIYQPIVFDRILSDAEASEIYTSGIDGLAGAVALNISVAECIDSMGKF